MKLFKRSLIPLLLITLFAFGQRFYNIESNPPSLNWDEVSHGYNAFSILLTGKDEWGTRLPLIFRAFGDYKLPLYIYLTIIPVRLLGLTPTAIRLVSVLAGTLAIPGIYLLSKKIFPKIKSLPLIAAFLLAITPWHFFISRPALEANLALTLIIFGFWALLKGIEKPKFYLLSSVLLGLSLHTYNTARVFVPLLFLLFLIIYRPKLKAKLPYILSCLIGLLSLSLMVYQVYSGTGTARYSKLSILSDSAVYQIGQARSESNLSPVLAKIKHNRPLYFTKEFTKNYLSYFSPRFFYQIQGVQKQFAIPGKNLFTLPITILYLIGLVSLLLKKKTKTKLFLFSWLLLSPVAAALTADPPQALRPNPLIPVIIIFASLGFVFLVDLFKKRHWAKTAVTISLILSCLVGYVRYLNSYYGSYRTSYSSSWQYGYQEVMDFVDKEKESYDRIIFTKRYGEPHIFYAFFTQISPQVMYSKDETIRFKQSDWYWTDRIKDTYFVNDWDIPEILTDTLPLESGGEVEVKNSLLVVSPQSLPKNVRVLKTISFLDGQPAFYIVSL
jgi:4-amino-4-deoxy-L-arabinose transferase-like glycosyltransferase